MALAIAACDSLPRDAGPPPRSSAPAATITLDPLMSRGPASAAVTIVEFSDYQ